MNESSPTSQHKAQIGASPVKTTATAASSYSGVNGVEWFDAVALSVMFLFFLLGKKSSKIRIHGKLVQHSKMTQLCTVDTFRHRPKSDV